MTPNAKGEQWEYNKNSASPSTKLIEDPDETPAVPSRKRRRPLDSKGDLGAKEKIAALADIRDLPSTSSSYPSSKETKSSVTTEEELEMELESMEAPRYRFEMLNHTVSKEATLREICDAWGITPPSGQWDLIDHLEKKLVLVITDCKQSKAWSKYNNMRSDIPDNSSAYFLEIGVVRGRWLGDDMKEVKGEEKIQQFCLQRKQVFEELGLSLTSVGGQPNMEDLMFCSKYINESVSEWKNALLKDQMEKSTTKELYAAGQGPMSVSAAILLSYLKDTRVKSDTRKETPWRGKLLPEPYIENQISWDPDDQTVVNQMFDDFKDCLSSLERMRMPENDKSLLQEDILPSLISIWETSGKRHFDLLGGNASSYNWLLKVLGVDMKNKTYNEEKKDEKQTEFKEILEENYPLWYEDVIEGLSERHLFDGYVANSELLVTPTSDKHPIAELIEPSCTEILKDMLETKASLYSSRITNLYSRLCGSYHGELSKSGKKHKNVAVIPLIANLSMKESLGLDLENTKLRLVSGILIRARPHARRGTDRINFITIEKMIRNQKTEYFLRYLPTSLVYLTRDWILVVRQNSIMKEDGSYNMYTSNALFTPMDMLGCMTLENPNFKRSCIMSDLISTTYEQGKKWFLDRYIEGVIFAVIGNSRDEGYFACLRKIFMVVLSYRRNKPCANYDIENFCRKTNECLIDNPISKHFHNTLLDLLEIYAPSR